MTYSEFMDTLVKNWNYKYHNTASSIVEPYPVELKPSEIYELLHPNNLSIKIKQLLEHADYLHSNPKLKKFAPYTVTFNYNNSKPFIINLYATSKRGATYLGIKKFSDYLKQSNSARYSSASINLDINNGLINIKVLEI